MISLVLLANTIGDHLPPNKVHKGFKELFLFTRLFVKVELNIIAYVLVVANDAPVINDFGFHVCTS